MRSHFVKPCPIWPGFPCRLCCPSTPGVANEPSPSGWATPRSNAVCGFPPLPRVSGASGRMRLGRLRLGRRARGSLSVETTHGGDPQLHRTTWSDRRLRQPGDDVGEVITQIVETLDYTHRRLADGEGSDETSQVSANRVEPEPPLALSVSSSQISEGGSSTITATNKNGDTFTVDQTVTFQLAGTATEGANYTITPPSQPGEPQAPPLSQLYPTAPPRLLKPLSSLVNTTGNSSEPPQSPYEPAVAEEEEAEEVPMTVAGRNCRPGLPNCSRMSLRECGTNRRSPG